MLYTPRCLKTKDGCCEYNVMGCVYWREDFKCALHDKQPPIYDKEGQMLIRPMIVREAT